MAEILLEMLLIGDPAKTKDKLGWVPDINFALWEDRGACG